MSQTSSNKKSTPEADFRGQKRTEPSTPIARLAVSAAIQGANEWLATPSKASDTQADIQSPQGARLPSSHELSTVDARNAVEKEQQHKLSPRTTPEKSDYGGFGEQLFRNRQSLTPATTDPVILSSKHSNTSDLPSFICVPDGSDVVQGVQGKPRISADASLDTTAQGTSPGKSRANWPLSGNNGCEDDFPKAEADGLFSQQSDGSYPNRTHFIQQWLKGTCDEKRTDLMAKFNDPEIQHERVDPTLGEFLSPLNYPNSIPFPAPDEDAEMQWKRLNMTAALNISRVFTARKQLAHQIRQREVDQEWGRREAERAPSPEWPRSPYPLRPAGVGDMTQIAQIMTMESAAETSPQIVASSPMTAEDVRRILDKCAANYRPFVVAYQEDVLLHLHNWPKGSEKAHGAYVKFRETQPREAEEVVGFAYVDEARAGFLQTPCPGSRYSGQIRLVVHPDHRREKVGQSLLDCVLSRIITGYQTQIEFEWRCEDERSIYSRMRNFNVRDYTHLFVEVLVHCDDQETDTWKSALLEKYDFVKVAHLGTVVRTDRGSGSAWLDLQLWQMKTHVVVRDKPPGAYLEDM